MPEKAKRKVNARQRLLFHLILGIVIFGTSAFFLKSILKPQEAQIVFESDDDNGISHLWIADMNDLENPRQLTFNDIPVQSFMVSESRQVLVYALSNTVWEIDEVRHLNLVSGEETRILECGVHFNCSDYNLDPNGQWFVYLTYTLERDAHSLNLYNLETAEQRTLFERYGMPANPQLLQWIEEGTQLIFRINRSDYAIYSLEEDHVINTLSLEDYERPPLFSEDGAYYIYDLYKPADTPLSLLIRQSSDNEIVWESEPHVPAYLSFWSSHVIAWLPNNEALIVLDRGFDGFRCCHMKLNLYTIATGEVTTLLEMRDPIGYSQVLLNDDGSQFLTTIYNQDAHDTQTILYDLVNREEIPLPIFGNSQWLNGDTNAR